MCKGMQQPCSKGQAPAALACLLSTARDVQLGGGRDEATKETPLSPGRYPWPAGTSPLCSPWLQLVQKTSPISPSSTR